MLLRTEMFLKTVIPLLSNKFLINEEKNLIEGNEIISTNSKSSHAFCIFSSKTDEKLKIPNISNYTHNESNDSLKEGVSYLENYPSIENIKRKGFDPSSTFKNCRPVSIFLNLSKIYEKLLYQ